MSATHPEAKFKVGDKVAVDHPQFGHWTGEVLMVNWSEDWEYLISNGPEFAPSFPCLVWEFEMRTIQ